MNNILLLITSAVLLTSCGFLKKNFSDKKSKVDSSVVLNRFYSDVKKKDSTGKEISFTTTKLNSDSGYTKTTTVREVFADEFDFEGSRADTSYLVPSKKAGTGKITQAIPKRKLLYRVTEIKETGAVKRSGEQVAQVSQEAQVKENDSIVNKGKSTVDVNKSDVVATGSKNRFTIGNGWFVLAFAVLLFLFLMFRILKDKLDFNPFE